MSFYESKFQKFENFCKKIEKIVDFSDILGFLCFKLFFFKICSDVCLYYYDCRRCLS